MSLQLISKVKRLKQLKRERQAATLKQKELGKPAPLPSAETLKEFLLNYVWPVLEPGCELDDNWHIDLLCEYLEDLYYNRKTTSDLIINIAPRHLKSRICSIAFPCWVWTKEPSLRFLCLSYAGSLATDHNDARRRVIESEQYQRLTEGTCELSSSKNRITEFQNSSAGEMVARGLDGAVTGGGGDIIIFDDPNNPDKVESDNIRRSTDKKFRDYSITRKNHPKETRILLIQQRTHELDCTGVAMQQGYRQLKLPTVAIADETIVFPQSRRTAHRITGDYLHPSRFGEAQATQAKEVLGSYMWSARHQQDPVPMGGGLFKEHDWRFWQPSGTNLPPVPLVDAAGKEFRIEPVTRPSNFAVMVQSLDASFKNLDTSDFACNQVWGKLGSDFYLIDQWHKQATILETCQSLLDFARLYPLATRQLIEDKANGPAAIQLLQNRLSGLTPCNPKGGKEARAIATQPSVEGHHTYLPHPAIAPWVWDFIGEHTKFPRGANDDQVDAHTQAKIFLLEADAAGDATPPPPPRKTPFDSARKTSSELKNIFS